jgi:hypothetical protein
MAQRYYITLSDPSQARGSDPELSFRAHGADQFAAELQAALRTAVLFERWRLQQEEPDEVDPALGVTDPQARVDGAQRGLKIDLVATTSIPGSVLRHRMRQLAGGGWALHDVTAA